MLNGLNHITLATENIEKSLYFYTKILNFKGHVKWDKGAYLSLNELWLCLSLDKPDVKKDYTHIAFNTCNEHFNSLKQKVVYEKVSIWKDNNSEGQSIYILDPSGHKLEIHVGSLQTRLNSLKLKPYSGLVWLS